MAIKKSVIFKSIVIGGKCCLCSLPNGDYAPPFYIGCAIAVSVHSYSIYTTNYKEEQEKKTKIAESQTTFPIPYKLIILL